MADRWERISGPEPLPMLRLELRAYPGVMTFFGPQDLSVRDGAALLDALMDEPVQTPLALIKRPRRPR